MTRAFGQTERRIPHMLSASRSMVGIVTGLAMLAIAALPAAAQSADTYQEDEIVTEAGDLFGEVSEGLADPVHSIVTKYGGRPAFIEGEEASAAFLIGLGDGQGERVMKKGTRQSVYWQGASGGWGFRG